MGYANVMAGDEDSDTCHHKDFEGWQKAQFIMGQENMGIRERMQHTVQKQQYRKDKGGNLKGPLEML